MYRRLTVTLLAFLFQFPLPTSVQSSTRDGNAIVIPLNQIWAYYIPGTRDVRKLEPQLPDAGSLSDEEFVRKHQIQQILRRLKAKPNKRAEPAFIVIGEGKEALENATPIFNNVENAKRVVPTNANLSLVVYSHLNARYFRIKSVVQSHNAIKVNYQFVPHTETNMTSHFALIPLGKLPEGTFNVQFEQVKSSETSNRQIKPLIDPHRYLSDSFSFEVKK